jgi:hypothetical protein
MAIFVHNIKILSQFVFTTNCVGWRSCFLVYHPGIRKKLLRGNNYSMKTIKNSANVQFSDRFRLSVIIFLIAYMGITNAYSQKTKLSVRAVSPMNFGAFTQGISSGTVTISPQNIRSATGSVILLNISGYTSAAAVFEVNATKNTPIAIATGLTGTLTGSNGGSLELQIENTYPASPFTTATNVEWKVIQVGGTLLIGPPASNPPGTYSGTFNVTFVFQ